MEIRYTTMEVSKAAVIYKGDYYLIFASGTCLSRVPACQRQYIDLSTFSKNNSNHSDILLNGFNVDKYVFLKVHEHAGKQWHVIAISWYQITCY